MQAQHHHVFSPRQENTRDRVDQRIEIACPSSIVFQRLEQYVRVQGNPLELFFPSNDGGHAEALAFVKHITVDVKAHPNKTFLGRHDDRLEIRWHSAQDLRLSFVGKFATRPLGNGTELTLKGRYDPPFLALEVMFFSVFDQSAGQAIARALLEKLKAVLETELVDLGRTNKSEARRGGPRI